MASKFITLFQNLNPKNRVEIFSFNGKKFRIDLLHRNGTPLGFNSNCCLSIMKDDGTLSHIADNKAVGCRFENLYFLDNGDKRIIEVNNRCLTAFRNFVKAVYA